VKYEVKTEDDGSVSLQLGLNHGATFDKGVNPQQIAQGVNDLVSQVVGVSVVELATAVMEEFTKDYVNG
jgi:hypothetical protein